MKENHKTIYKQTSIKKDFKTRKDWVKKMILWEFCKSLKFDHTTKLYIHKPESVPEHETHKILWNFYVQTDHPILVKRPDLVLINNFFFL